MTDFIILALFGVMIYIAAIRDRLRRTSPAPATTAHRTFGTMVCNGVTLDIVDITMTDGKIFLHCWTFGTHTVEGPMTVFGTDGSGLFQGGHCPPASSKRANMTIHLPMQIISCETVES